MSFDFKKEYKEFYMPKNKPSIIEVPKMNYVAVRGTGNPNEENSDYKNTIALLYGVAYVIKMSYKGTHKIDGFFEYVVPPLEGFWWQDGLKKSIDYNNKDKMNFISMIRLPDFVTKEDFDWAIEEATKKKKQDFSRVEFLTYDEGLCVQCMHIGSYDGATLRFRKQDSLQTTPAGMMISLQKCLTKNDLSSYIKDTYTEEELSMLLIKLRSKELDLGTPANEIYEEYKKISIKDIVVVDTSKESGDSVLVEGEKKYYVLIPYDSGMSTVRPDVTCYEICDHTGFGNISFDRKSVRIGNIVKTFYYVFKFDGELECVSSLENVLKEIGLEEYIREEYALIDLQNLAHKINEKQKVLTRN